MEDQPVPSSGFALNKKTILSIVGVVVLLAATGLGVYLAQQKQLFKPKAFETKPVSAPETSFSLNAASSVNVGDEVRISVFVRSDIDAANLFAAKLRFPTELLEVKSIEADVTVDQTKPVKVQGNSSSGSCPPGYYWANGQCVQIQPTSGSPAPSSATCPPETYWNGQECVPQGPYPSGPPPSEEITPTPSWQRPPGYYFVKNWVEKMYDNKSGTVSLVGGVPSPGHQTNVKDTGSLMAEIVFRTKTNGIATVSFDPDSAIYRNSDNENILNMKREVSFKIQAPQPTPSSVGVSMEPSSIRIVSSVNGTQLGFNMTATVDNANVYLVLPNAFINKISYVYTRGLMRRGEVRPVYLKVEPFTAPGVYKGTGILRNGDNNQQITFPIEVTVSSAAISPTPTPAGIPGDVNRDNKITLVDMSALLTKWGAQGAEAGRADINRDGIVNSFDYATMIKVLIENGVIKGVLDLPSSLQLPR